MNQAPKMELKIPNNIVPEIDGIDNGYDNNTVGRIRKIIKCPGKNFFKIALGAGMGDVTDGKSPVLYDRLFRKLKKPEIG